MARRLGVARSTAHRLLTMLCNRGLAEEKPATRQAKRLRPTHCSSAGKAIAAFDPALAAARRAAEFPPRTDTAIFTASDLERAPAQVRRTWYATNLGEAVVGGAAVAARALNRSGRGLRRRLSRDVNVGFTRDVGRPGPMGNGRHPQGRHEPRRLTPPVSTVAPPSGRAGGEWQSGPRPGAGRCAQADQRPVRVAPEIEQKTVKWADPPSQNRRTFIPPSITVAVPLTNEAPSEAR
ncbi:IclR family transcriptional regulator C-terminal domain-containing protein [Streptomyces sp. NPDC101152]|uniref:helix-turn-helix domain-containing protein n=1 Tax=Streptomyces sp. NPDC101152 TaxID=3366116 RepID=UPI0038036E8F